mgnify:CR=1 FL=1
MRERKKKTPGATPRFGVLDVVIILLIIVAVVGVYFRYNILVKYILIEYKKWNKTLTL